MTEVWKDIEGYEYRYEVSNLGRVRSKDTHCHPGQIRKLMIQKEGYYKVMLSDGQHRKTYWVHRLVATAFVPNPENLPQVNHIDECKTNNRADNLEWVTLRQNALHGTRNKRLSENHVKKHSVIQMSIYGTYIAEYPSVFHASQATGINKSSIRNCCNKKPRYLSAGGYRWKYKEQ